MPLTESTASPKELAETLKNDAKDSGASSFVAVYASHVATPAGGSQSWCGDCIAAEPLVEKKFGGKFGEKCWVVWAGDKAEWRTPDNVWRKAPFSITNLPTLIKVTPEGKWEKLVEGDVYNQRKLDAFVGF
ncbi:hypothetical protein BFW01_g984 [Lasiodiplodia theobromae]|uniref:Thioredoxin-like protein Clot n=1 Tax=Lasiodiplodia theobromae TaxID=45133 RepID=A0A5N5CVK8_9PEZI|nr:Thioredoxin-like protein 5 [Lasiodiplodia theobromae]KAB2569383.1 Thioredoxin-like protein Clot [Lasiodiplodia theobromae]KAF4546283.1 Thioredoxin-like protein 5 [Lasiodiplodia theobromae]KAF9630422.1 hypothetical protein BFW01_g984 [Lasiodiplodia theobromae]